MGVPQQRSSFVTVLAWIFIGLSGPATLIAILQNIMIQTLFKRLDPQAMQATAPPGTPAAVDFLMNHFQLFFLAFLVVSVLSLVSSIGLLKRWNWARLCFIALLGLGIAWNLGGLAIQYSMLSFAREQIAATSTPGAPDMQPFFIGIGVFAVLFAVGFSVLFGWIAKRLLSAPIAAEFRQSRAPA